MGKKKRKMILSVLLSAGLAFSSINGMAGYAAAASKATVGLNKTQATVEKGKKVTLRIVKTNVKKVLSVKWVSKNEKIATVNSKGVVTGKKAGSSTVITCTVKYQAEGSKEVQSPKLKCKVNVKKDAETNEELYTKAVDDAAIAKEDEIRPLVSLTKQDPLVTWDDQGRVLLCTWHSYPDSYPQGDTVTAEWGYIWTFTDKEIATYAKELKESKDAVMRMRQLISISPDKQHSTVTGLWVNPDDVIRPAYQSDATKGNMTTAFPDGEVVDEQFKSWFDQNILDSYYYGKYPWTRLGYTYDWADNEKEYGLTEFLVKKGAQAEVAFTETTDEFLQRLYRELP